MHTETQQKQTKDIQLKGKPIMITAFSRTSRFYKAWHEKVSKARWYYRLNVIRIVKNWLLPTILEDIYNCYGSQNQENIQMKLDHIDLSLCYQYYQKVFEKILLQILAPFLLTKNK